MCRYDLTTDSWQCACPEGFQPVEPADVSLRHGQTKDRSAANKSGQQSARSRKTAGSEGGGPLCADINECKIGYPTPGRNPCPDLYR